MTDRQDGPEGREVVAPWSNAVMDQRERRRILGDWTTRYLEPLSEATIDAVAHDMSRYVGDPEAYDLEAAIARVEAR